MRHAVAIRTCVGCRKRFPAQELLRLQVDEAGVLVPTLQKRQAGRAAWVCASGRCVRRLAKNPKGLHRALRRKPSPKVAGLQERLKNALEAQIVAQLAACRRAGLVVSGAQRLAKATDLRALMVAKDASKTTLQRLKGREQGWLYVEMGVDRVGLGDLIGKGPRAVLGIRVGRPSRLLCVTLQQYVDLS